MTTLSWWRDQNDLDPEQKAIIQLDVDGDYLLLGPPGCGKTNILALRGTYVARMGKPNIVLLSFTRTLIHLDKLSAHIWANVIVGECFAQLPASVQLVDLPLAAALNCDSFIYARGRAVWGAKFSAQDAALLWSNFAQAFAHSQRRLGPANLRTIWSAVDDLLTGTENVTADNEWGRLVNRALKDVQSYGGITDATWAMLGYSDLPEPLKRIGETIQQERLREFDKLLTTIHGSSSDLVSFVVGAAAAVVANCRMQNIDLLRPVVARFPTSAIWFSLYSAVANRSPIGADFAGFGRQIAKELLLSFDITAPPRCDIGLAEFRMMSQRVDQRLPTLRTFSRNVVGVEVIPGVVGAVSNPSLRDHVSSQSKGASESHAKQISAPALRTALADIRRAVDRAQQLVTETNEPRGMSDVDQDEEESGLMFPKPRSRSKKPKPAKSNKLF